MIVHEFLAILQYRACRPIALCSDLNSSHSEHFRKYNSLLFHLLLSGGAQDSHCCTCTSLPTLQPKASGPLLTSRHNLASLVSSRVLRRLRTPAGRTPSLMFEICQMMSCSKRRTETIFKSSRRCPVSWRIKQELRLLFEKHHVHPHIRSLLQS
jgi:hypothetical protein